MNMNALPFDSPAQHLAKIRESLQAISAQIRRLHVNATQKILIGQAKAWGWEIVKRGNRHPLKAVRVGYAPVVIPGHGNNAPIKRGLALSVLQALAAPLQSELNASADRLTQHLALGQMADLQTQIADQANEIQDLQAKVAHLEIEAETGLTLAAEIEYRNDLLNRRITDLLHERLELEAQKRQILGLIQERQMLEQKFDLFTADFEQLEVTLDDVVDYAKGLPAEFQQPLMAILRPFRVAN